MFIGEYDFIKLSNKHVILKRRENSGALILDLSFIKVTLFKNFMDIWILFSECKK